MSSLGLAHHNDPLGPVETRPVLLGNVVLARPLVKVIREICSCLTKRSTAAMNDLLMGFMSAEEAKVAPR